MSIGLWLAIGAGILLLGAFLYWAFIVTEGAYLGARVVAWTYDLAAPKYDDIKQFNGQDDTWLLAGPMIHRLRAVNGPLILDVATGTGRMPLALLHHHQFHGYVIALDLSRKMLLQAQQKLVAHAGRYALLWQDAQDLPISDDTFDAVSCLEALEFMPSPQTVLREMVRVLRPGGVLVVTNRVNWERKLMPGKAFADDKLTALLQDMGLVDVEIRPWQVYYDLIWAHKAGQPSRLGRATQALGTSLRCPQCGATPLNEKQHQLCCPACARVYPVSQHVVELCQR
jgi:ubiquinone/menaquinone biosynthesis C-methylase UbiE